MNECLMNEILYALETVRDRLQQNIPQEQGILLLKMKIKQS